MQIDTFMLAEAAVAQEGKLYIHGGGLTRLTPPGYPWVHPQLAMVIRVLLDPEDEGQDISLRITATGPEGEPLVPALEGSVQGDPRADRQEGESIFVHMGVTLGVVPFETPGAYTFEITLNDEMSRSERLFMLDPNR